VGVGLLVIVYRFLAFEPQDGHAAGRRQLISAFSSVLVAGVVVIVGLIVVAMLPETPILTLTNVPVEPIALVAAVPLGYLALQILGSRDGRRFAVGFVVAAVGWFAVLYPNISALPLPNAVAPMYQGILPTYLYAFQFPVSTVDRNTTTPLLTPMFAVLLAALAATCVIVAYSAWVWRLGLADAAAAAAGAGASDDGDGLARTGGA
jgi:hypothetical protein